MIVQIWGHLFTISTLYHFSRGLSLTLVLTHGFLFNVKVKHYQMCSRKMVILQLLMAGQGSLMSMQYTL